MTLLRTIVSVLSLVALVASICVPASASAARGDVVVAASVAAEPCPASHGTARCELKALPTDALVSTTASTGTHPVIAAAATTGRGTWPEVEPDPPRAGPFLV